MDLIQIFIQVVIIILFIIWIYSKIKGQSIIDTFNEIKEIFYN